jgi:hypothetical protein
LDGCKSALEECIIDDVALTVFAVNDPFASIYVPKPGVGRNGAGILALLGVHQ